MTNQIWILKNFLGDEMIISTQSDESDYDQQWLEALRGDARRSRHPATRTEIRRYRLEETEIIVPEDPMTLDEYLQPEEYYPRFPEEDLGN